MIPTRRLPAQIGTVAVIFFVYVLYDPCCLVQCTTALHVDVDKLSSSLESLSSSSSSFHLDEKLLSLYTKINTTREQELNPQNKNKKIHDVDNDDAKLIMFPLIGIGVGNLQHERIVDMIKTCILMTTENSKKTIMTTGTSTNATVPQRNPPPPHPPILIDTAHASRNEALIRQGIDSAIDELLLVWNNSNITHDPSDVVGSSSSINTKPIAIVIIDVVTKVWYTHLGYERTLISVHESLHELRRGRNGSSTTQTKKKATATGSTASNTNVRRNSNHISSNGNNNNNKNRNIHVKIRVHMLLHWPRCRSDISWMDCNGEEEQLDDIVKNAGPKPNSETSFLESWRALEDIYLGIVNETTSSTSTQEGNNNDKYENNEIDSTTITTSVQIESIGISNFDRKDLQELLAIARVTPHIVQNNVWSYIFDPYFMELCQQYKIHFQAYNVINGIKSNYRKCPNAYNTLERIGKQLSIYIQHEKDIDSKTLSSLLTFEREQSSSITVLQVVLSWFVYHKVSIIPRTGNVQHFKSNSPMILGPIVHAWYNVMKQNTTTNTTITDTIIKNSIRSLLQGQDLSPVYVTFCNSIVPSEQVEEAWDLYWKDPTTPSTAKITTNDATTTANTQSTTPTIVYLTTVLPNTNYTISTHPGHIFLISAVHKEKDHNSNSSNTSSNYSHYHQEYVVTSEYGEEQVFYLPFAQYQQQQQQQQRQDGEQSLPLSSMNHRKTNGNINNNNDDDEYADDTDFGKNNYGDDAYENEEEEL